MAFLIRVLRIYGWYVAAVMAFGLSLAVGVGTLVAEALVDESGRRKATTLSSGALTPAEVAGVL